MQLVMSKVPQAPAAVRPLPQGTTPAVCHAPRLRMLLASCIDWEVPIWELDRQTEGKPLSTILRWVRPLHLGLPLFSRVFGKLS